MPEEKRDTDVVRRRGAVRVGAARVARDGDSDAQQLPRFPLSSFAHLRLLYGEQAPSSMCRWCTPRKHSAPTLGCKAFRKLGHLKFGRCAALLD